LQLRGAITKESHWGPALDSDRAIDPMRYRPLQDQDKDFSNGHFNDNTGNSNLAFIGDDKVKYIPSESNRM